MRILSSLKSLIGGAKRLSQLRKFLKDVIYLDVQNSKTNNLGVVKLTYTSLFLNDLKSVVDGGNCCIWSGSDAQKEVVVVEASNLHFDQS